MEELENIKNAHSIANNSSIELSIENFNKGRIGTHGAYLISMSTSYRPYYALWRLFEGHEHPLFIQSLALTLDEALHRAYYMLNNCNIALYIPENNIFDACYGTTDDIILFGKYKGKHMAEIYSIDPAYVLWLANNFEPHNKRYEIIKKIAKAFSVIHLELTIRKGNISSLSRYVGEEGEILKDLYLNVLNVRLQVDNYKPNFYVDQNVLAVDKNGNRFIFYVKARGKSLLPEILSCHSRVINIHETVHLFSGKVMKHYMRNGVQYTRLGYIKLD